MRLKTLGGLSLEGSSFGRLKPLLLLSYLSLEGEQSRAFMAQLIWGTASQPFNSLAQAIDQLKRLAPGTIEANPTHVKSLISSDARVFINAFESADYEKAIDLYKGSFLDQIYLKNVSFEVEDWLLGSRELLAAYAQTALINLALNALQSDKARARTYAEKAYKLQDQAPLTEMQLQQLFSLLSQLQSPFAAHLAKEADQLGLKLSQPQIIKQREPASALPSYANRFFGRISEQQEIKHMITQPECQLLTLSGPGGIGKTRLATELSHQLQANGDFDLLCFINLEPLTSPEQMLAAVAQNLGLRLDPQVPPLEQITQNLQAKTSLLILDNFEHLLFDESTALIDALLRACQGLNLLITSRERLNLPQEWLLPLDALSQPEESLKTTEQAESYDAINLFLDRAKRANIHFKLSQDNLAEVQQLTDLSSGLPLAIELAASWLSALSPEAITQELKKNLDILSSNTHSAKHQSLKTTFEHSWNRLSQAEQTIMQGLSSFEEGFSKDAATQLTGISYLQLSALIGKSLIQSTQSGRYSLHPLLKQYLEEKLFESGQSKELQGKHATFYLAYLTEISEGLGTADESKALNAIALDLANIKKAWLHECSHGDPDPALPRQLRRFFDTSGRYPEGIDLLQKSALELGYKPILLGSILSAQAFLLFRMGRLLEAKELGEKAYALLETKDKPELLVNTLTSLAVVNLRLGSHEIALAHFRNTLEMARKAKMTTRLPTYLSNLAIVEMERGFYQQAEEHFNEALELARSQQSSNELANILNNLGKLHLILNDLVEAHKYFSESLTLNKNDLRLFHLTQINLASVLIKLKDFNGAEDLCNRSLAFLKDKGLAEIGFCLRVIGQMKYAQKKLALALKNLKASVYFLQHSHQESELITTLRFLGETYLEVGEIDLASKCFQVVINYPKTEAWVKEEALNLLLRTDMPERSDKLNPGLVSIVEVILENFDGLITLNNEAIGF